MEPGCLAAALGLVEIGIRDESQSSTDQIVVHIPLALEFFFLAILLGEPTLHLLETMVVELRRIGVQSGNFGLP